MKDNEYKVMFVKKCEKLRKLGKTWKEIGMKFGLDESAVRKRYKRWKEIAESFEGEKQREQLVIEEAVKYWKKKAEKLEKEQAFGEAIVKLFEKRLSSGYKPKKLKKLTIKHTPEEEVMVLLLGDWHAGEVIESEAVMGLNEYNMDIFAERLKNVVTNVIKIKEGMSKEYRKLHVAFLGDIISGAIHDELLYNAPVVVDQVLDTASLASDALKKLSEYFEVIDVSGIIGNHGRFGRKKQYKFPYNNFDYLVYKYIEISHQNTPNIFFYFPKSSMLLEKIFDWNFLLYHGTEIKAYQSIPFYGVLRATAQLSQIVNLKDTILHYLILGHFHTPTMLEKIGGNIIINGSLKGVDEYTLGRMFTASFPSQILFSVHPRNGITWTMNIRATE